MTEKTALREALENASPKYKAYDREESSHLVNCIRKIREQTGCGLKQALETYRKTGIIEGAIAEIRFESSFSTAIEQQRLGEEQNKTIQDQMFDIKNTLDAIQKDIQDIKNFFKI